MQIMLQVTLACVGCLTLIWIGEAQYERAIRYWCQGMFAATVTIPMLARRFVKSGLPRGPRRDWWKKTCEAVFFSFLTMLLVTAGGLFQVAVYALAVEFPGSTAQRPIGDHRRPAAQAPGEPGPVPAGQRPSSITDDAPQSPREPSPGPG